VKTLEDSWNEEYGPYIAQIDEPRNSEGFDELNCGLRPVDVDNEPPRPPPAAGAAAAAAAPQERTFNGCSVCYGELNLDNWWICMPCKHCFCQTCVETEIHPTRLENESYLDHFMRCKVCPVCRGEIDDAYKIYPNYVVLTESDQFVPVVRNDDEDNAEAVVVAVEEEEEAETEAAAARRLENQRMLASLMHTERHRGPPQASHNWDTLQDEIGLEDFDLSQPHTQPQPPAGLRPLATLGEERSRGRGRGRGRGGRGGRRGKSSIPGQMSDQDVSFS
jgi:hypothetical protein